MLSLRWGARLFEESIVSIKIPPTYLLVLRKILLFIRKQSLPLCLLCKCLYLPWTCRRLLPPSVPASASVYVWWALSVATIGILGIAGKVLYLCPGSEFRSFGGKIDHRFSAFSCLERVLYDCNHRIVFFQLSLGWSWREFCITVERTDLLRTPSCIVLLLLLDIARTAT